MHYELTETTARITCTFGELVNMDSNHLAIYATPRNDVDRVATQLYIGSRPNFMYDFAIATVRDFCEAEGWDSLGWEDMDEDEMEEAAGDTITVEVSRSKSADQRAME